MAMRPPVWPALPIAIEGKRPTARCWAGAAALAAALVDAELARGAAGAAGRSGLVELIDVADDDPVGTAARLRDLGGGVDESGGDARLGLRGGVVGAAAEVGDGGHALA